MIKKFFVLVCITFCFSFPCFANNNINFFSYLNADYVGVSYQDALKSNKPFLLIFANPKDIFLIAKLVPVGREIYNKYNNNINFCILNFYKPANSENIKYYKVKSPPALFVVDPYFNKAYLMDNQCINNPKSFINKLDGYLRYRHYELN